MGLRRTTKVMHFIIQMLSETEFTLQDPDGVVTDCSRHFGVGGQ